jgi:hypothetical protein
VASDTGKFIIGVRGTTAAVMAVAEFGPNIVSGVAQFNRELIDAV